MTDITAVIDSVICAGYRPTPGTDTSLVVVAAATAAAATAIETVGMTQ